MARLVVLVKPGSRAPGFAIESGVVIVRVRQRAIEGAANAACIHALAQILGVAPSACTLLRGERGRHKCLEIAGLTDDEVLARLRGRGLE